MNATDPDDQPEKDTWFKFFPRDWLSDKELQLCSLAARGLWIEILAISHAECGRLRLNSGAISISDLARLVGASPAQVRRLLAELVRRNVASVDAENTVYSRRMVRDAKRREVNRKNGKQGGNPALLGPKSVNPTDNRPVNPPDKAKRPETRDQKDPVQRDPGEAPAPGGEPSADTRDRGALPRFAKPRTNADRTGLIDGYSNRDHGSHAWCGTREGLCVQWRMHRDFRSLGQKTDAELRAWYPTIVAKYEGQPIGDDPMRLWREEFRAWVGTAVQTTPTRPAPISRERVANRIGVDPELADLCDRAGIRTMHQSLWFTGVGFERLPDGAVRLTCTDQQQAQSIEQHYGEALRTALAGASFSVRGAA